MSLLVETRYEHVILNEAKVPTVAGTTMKVVELVLEKRLTVGARNNSTTSIPT